MLEVKRLKMQAVILAAGMGKRLQPLTDTIPKAMLPLNGQPLLKIMLGQLKSVGVTEIIIVVNHLKERIINYFGNGSQFGLSLTYVEQKEMKGTADAVLQAAPYITATPFFCIACDSLFETELLQRILNNGKEGVFACKEVPDPRRFGVLVTEKEKVLKIVEKPEHPPTNLANFSVYLLPKEIFLACKLVSPGIKGEYLLTDALQKLIDFGKPFGYEISEHILDIGTPEQLREAEGLVKKLRL